MRQTVDWIIVRSTFRNLLVLTAVSAVTMFMLFSPSSPWFTVTEAVTFPAPETLPAFDTEAVFEFLAVLTAEQRGTYLKMHSYDALYYSALTIALLCLFGLVLKRFGWTQSRLVWVLTIPMVLFGFEALESIALVSATLLMPARIEVLLWLAEIATAGKVASYLVAIVFFALAVLLLPVSIFLKRS